MCNLGWKFNSNIQLKNAALPYFLSDFCRLYLEYKYVQCLKSSLNEHLSDIISWPWLFSHRPDSYPQHVSWSDDLL